MKGIKEVVKDFKSFTDWIYGIVSGAESAPQLSEEEFQFLDDEGYKLIEGRGVDMFMPKASKIASLNILHKKVDFSIFKDLPKVWTCYQGVAEILVEARRS